MRSRNGHGSNYSCINGEWTVIRREDKLRLVIYGVVLGLGANLLFTVPDVLRTNFNFGLAVTIMVIVDFLILIALATKWVKGTRVRRTRLFFFGISLISFLFAIGDLMQFAFGSHVIKVSGDYPYIWIGDIAFVSMLTSLSLGGLFSMIERFLELHEKKDL
jgi:hypothetical protein